MIEEARWFGPEDEALFGWFARPDDGVATVGVVLCASVGEEEHNAHQTYRELAAALAQRGVASLRFDHHGTGDSLGDWDAPDRVAAWVHGVAEAEQALRASGVTVVSAVGMRFGAALLAAASTRAGVQLDRLVLWDPCGGKDLLREGYARRPAAAELGAGEGAVDTPGYRYPAATAAAMRALDLVALPGGPLARRTLVLTRDDRPVPRKLRVHLDGDTVTWEPVAGQSELLDRPMTHNVVPQAAVARVAAWLAEGDERDDATAAPLTTPGRPEVRIPVAPRPGVAEVTEVTEDVVRLGPVGLVAVRTRPARVTREPVVVLVNVANDRHVGPGRRWVGLARTWAGLGFEVLRLDQSGAGDSPCHPGQAFGTLYAREWLDDLPEAVADAVVGDRPVVFVSLCSGAYSAMETAFRVPVAAIYAINPILHARVTSRSSTLGDPRRRAARPPVRPLLRLGDRRPRLAAAAWRAYRQVTVWNAPAATVSALLRRGTDVVLVVSPADARHFRETAYWSAVHVPRWSRAGRYRLLCSPRVDHALMTQDAQTWAADAVTSDLLHRFPARSA